MTKYPQVQDVEFRFKQSRPRLVLGIASALAAYAVWLGLNPSALDAGHPTGAIDIVVRSMPDPARGVSCCVLAVAVLWTSYTTYWPCIRDQSITIFDGEMVRGYDVWGGDHRNLKSKSKLLFIETVALD